MNHPFFSQREARRSQRLASFGNVAAAVKQAAPGSWDLKERLNGDSFGRPSTLTETIKKAVASVRATLDSLGEFPVPPSVEYQSVRSVVAAAGGTERMPLISDGVVMLHARFLTKTGVRDSFDIPVMIKEGQVIEASVIMHAGTMKVLAPSSVREMVARGTFTQQAPSRGPFSAPLSHDETTQWNEIERSYKTHTRLNPGMFSVNGSAADMLRAAVRGDKEFRTAQLGEQPSRASMGFQASPGTRIGDRIVSVITWDADRLESMSDQNLHHAIRSYVLELGTKKEWRDWGTIADVQIDNVDRDDGSAEVSFKSSEISAPQLSAADFADLSKHAGFSVAAAYCEKCEVNHREKTKCPYANRGAPSHGAPAQAPAPAAKTDYASTGALRNVPPEHVEAVSNALDDLKQQKPTITMDDLAPISAIYGKSSLGLLSHLLQGKVLMQNGDKTYTFAKPKAAPKPKAPKPKREPMKIAPAPAPYVSDAMKARPAENASPSEHMNWVLDNMAEATQDDDAETLNSLDESFGNALKSVASEVQGMPEGKEKARAQQIMKEMGDGNEFPKYMSYTRNYNAIEEVVDHVRRNWGELNKLVGGQQQMFARRRAAIGPSQDETHLDPAERDKSSQFRIGDSVKLTKGQLLRNRGGGTDTLTKGTVGKVVGDLFGDGLTLKIVFGDSTEEMVIPASHVKKAGFEVAASSVTAEKVLTEIKNLRSAGYSPIDVILTTRQRYGALGESTLKQAKVDGLLDW